MAGHIRPGRWGAGRRSPRRGRAHPPGPL